MRNFLTVLILGALLVLPMTAAFADEGGGPEFVKICIGSHCVQTPADDGGGE